MTDPFAPLDRLRREVGNPDPADQSGIDKARHRAPSILERDDALIHPVKLVQVDHTTPQATEASLYGSTYITRPEPRPPRRGGDLREHHEVASIAYGLTDQLLRAAIPVDLCGVDPVLPGIDCAPYRREYLTVGGPYPPFGPAGFPPTKADG